MPPLLRMICKGAKDLASDSKVYKTVQYNVG